MPGRRISGRPQFPIPGSDDGPTGESQQKSGNIGLPGQQSRGNHSVVIPYPDHPLVEGLVAQSAQNHAVGNGVIAAFSPGNDVGGVHRRVSVCSEHAEATQGARWL